jgi:hypothetical protein
MTPSARAQILVTPITMPIKFTMIVVTAIVFLRPASYGYGSAQDDILTQLYSFAQIGN